MEDLYSTYAEIADAGDYSFEQHQANVVAMGNGENPGNGVIIAEFPACPDGMDMGDWIEYQNWLFEQEESRTLTEYNLLVAGAFSPRFD